ncbi:phosphotransferase enzyme family protein [Paenibacillus pini]|uniref:Protein kinase n=1 Tax=Paenibacillus pini JCM 16418 TaxID=1236976 RepID=W7YZB1_9BACL|nr:phosphotransferase [Paenibacillus pini]GAF07704.1 protein kinase [Paenibacillus pini JCM 16418]
MLSLKYLFTNEDLAKMVLNNWEFDPESIEMFKYYRISANAIYPFQIKGYTHLLRFAPTSEKSKENILAELDFISYLRKEGYGVLESVASRDQRELLELQTPWGEYYASVFKRVSGVQLNQTDFSDDIVFNYGKALGKLHQLSSVYIPSENMRWSYRDVLRWIQDVLIDFPEETAALKEAGLLQEYFAATPITERNFGLIHYDFEYDNVFYDKESSSCNVIDFDDAMYHWYAMDIEQALNSLKDCMEPNLLEDKKKCFMDGYLTEYDISEEDAAIVPACRRFANVYGYTRKLRSMAEKWDHEPEWLLQLRERLKESLEENSLEFGRQI